MDRMVAYCGIVCTACDAYLATKSGDRAALEAVAAKWRVVHGATGLTADGVICDGCLSVEGRLCSHAPHCDIRACGIERAVETCAHCANYACDRLNGLFAVGSPQRQVLDEIRAAL